ncbi:Uncharacterized protein Fot_20440 [Forsythia ovata]|uniref:Uncharacterized protein n=1 Tax=Forsythia ovata TaxID=205694 RepID=A0ABD1US57_9LAMI
MVGAPISFSGNQSQQPPPAAPQGTNTTENLDSKYTSLQPQLYATPNATISTLLPYNGFPPQGQPLPPASTLAPPYQTTADPSMLYPGQPPNSVPPATFPPNPTSHAPYPPSSAAPPPFPPYSFAPNDSYPPSSAAPVNSYPPSSINSYPPSSTNPSLYPPNSAAPSPFPAYPPNPDTYSSSLFSSAQSSAYPPQSCPPTAYPPQSNTYNPQAPSGYPTSGQSTGTYLPPPTDYYQLTNPHSMGIYPTPPTTSGFYPHH